MGWKGPHFKTIVKRLLLASMKSFRNRRVLWRHSRNGQWVISITNAKEGHMGVGVRGLNQYNIKTIVNGVESGVLEFTVFNSNI